MNAKSLKNLVASLSCLIAIAVALIIAGCSKTGDENKQAAIAAAQSWLSIIDRGQYSDSWDAAAPFFQGAVSESKWVESMNSLRKPMGDLVSRQLKSAQTMTQLPDVPAGLYVVMQFETSFSNNKSVIETVTVGPQLGKQWKASGYYLKTTQ